MGASIKTTKRKGNNNRVGQDDSSDGGKGKGGDEKEVDAWGCRLRRRRCLGGGEGDEVTANTH
uniref:Uncharacterized protein n=1 Tax=Oryza sativa subsp. japonica TaxID=39947 RepID=Q7EYR4_ORYSJ|nr:hypothetical protein [Oryza sativa Japonica Group]BAD30575.1 hypothetical protein [Oryza sativa Japonica Group]